jgi:hypothetical protein
MNLKEYMDAVVEQLTIEFPNNKIKQIDKNQNGIILNGVSILESSNQSPVFYINEFCERGDSVGKFIEYVKNYLDSDERKNYEEYTDKIVESIQDYDSVKDGLYLLTRDEDSIQKDVVSLAVPGCDTLRYVVAYFLKDGKYECKLQITGSLLKSWGKTAGEVFADAVDNHSKLDIILEPCLEYLVNHFELDPSAIPEEIRMASNPELVCTYKNNVELGSSAVFLNGRHIYEKLNCTPFYVIPSSIFETMILPNITFLSEDDIIDMIKQVNTTEVKPDEVLSYSTFYFDGNSFKEIHK